MLHSSLSLSLSLFLLPALHRSRCLSLSLALSLLLILVLWLSGSRIPGHCQGGSGMWHDAIYGLAASCRKRKEQPEIYLPEVFLALPWGHGHLRVRVMDVCTQMFVSKVCRACPKFLTRDVRDE